MTATTLTIAELLALSQRLAGELPDEEAAHWLLAELRYRFGWTTCVWTRADVDDSLGRPITDDEWERLRTSRAWDAISDVAYEYGNDKVWDAMSKAGLEE